MKDLVASCPTTGACVRSNNDAGVITAVCYANGVRAVFEGGVVRVTNADGTPCYSLEDAVSANNTDLFTWKDPAGTVVATARETDLAGMQSSTGQITCATGDQTPVCHSDVPKHNTCCIDVYGNPPPLGPNGYECVDQRLNCQTGSCP